LGRLGDFEQPFSNLTTKPPRTQRPDEGTRINGIIPDHSVRSVKRYVKEQAVAQQHTRVVRPYYVDTHWPTAGDFSMEAEMT
jgi:hypothetical protein